MFHTTDAPEVKTKQSAATPEYSVTAVLSSGCVAASTFDINVGIC
jgi:hypothetical protein